MYHSPNISHTKYSIIGGTMVCYEDTKNIVVSDADADEKRGSVKTVVICATGFILRSSTIFMYSPFQGSVKVASTNTEYFMLP